MLQLENLPLETGMKMLLLHQIFHLLCNFLGFEFSTLSSPLGSEIL
jgi:hypothetical protein